MDIELHPVYGNAYIEASGYDRYTSTARVKFKNGLTLDFAGLNEYDFSRIGSKDSIMQLLALDHRVVQVDYPVPEMS